MTISEALAMAELDEEVHSYQPVVLDNIAPASFARAENFVARYKLLEQIAQGMLGGSLTPKGVTKVSDVVMILMLGEELGIDYIQALRNIYVVNGRPVLGADLMAGSVKRFCEQKGGGYIRATEIGNESCTVEFKRHDEEEARTVTWTIEDAKRAGLLGKDNWRGYPADMLRARALTRAARIGWPDLLGGVYDPDEMTPASPEPQTVRRASSATIVDTNVDASAPAAIAPPKASDDDPISPEAFEALKEKAAERGIIDIEFQHYLWYRTGSDKVAELTTGEGRELFKELIKATDATQIDTLRKEISAAVDQYNHSIEQEAMQGVAQ